VTALLNGSYSFTVANAPPYSANVTGGEFTIHGSPRTIHVSYDRSSSSAGGVPWLWVAVPVVVAGAAAVLLLFVVRRRPPRRAGAPPFASPSAATTPPPVSRTDPPGP
jgi:hypothetical protein